eukprot:CAMPEP_0184341064 /NCGR_PEP_ID=MMETSP1089-20130417/9699_1 /TAXON_ID=38269 ORGANISM="Gloeochaete wittrockiana, Strain SAG46.84" /NCGR_SAMPLE_ID=MMETSP1089 /ASSEMBLY_ACC=CAM_ASM_000445 /LENGTH=256 /DNA_ID=CAMNT_0026669177 /DNA_START=126 /DNA_END=892 /DNA_ORIENTATION=+
MRIGVIGFGNFGQFLAKAFIKHNHQVFATSRTDYSHVAATLGVWFSTSVEEFCRQGLECVMLSPSILSLEKVMKSLPLSLLLESSASSFPNPVLFVDVLSVKVYPKELLSAMLPADRADLLCTHPMFGPQSGRDSWNGLPMVFERVRISYPPLCDAFLRIFEGEGCKMVPMTCEEHDRFAASSQFITHTVGRMLSQLHLESTPINTKGYELLLQVSRNTVADSFDLYYGLYKFNDQAIEQLERLEVALKEVKEKLL